jgi:hypothetical protein
MQIWNNIWGVIFQVQQYFGLMLCLGRPASRGTVVDIELVSQQGIKYWIANSANQKILKTVFAQNFCCQGHKGGQLIWDGNLILFQYLGISSWFKPLASIEGGFRDDAWILTFCCCSHATRYCTFDMWFRQSRPTTYMHPASSANSSKVSTRSSNV